MLGSANPLTQRHIPYGLNATGKEYLCFIKNEELFGSVQGLLACRAEFLCSYNVCIW